ncbi:MAG: hypothetical protein WBZ29_15400 [Methanocella sp.]
MKIGKWLTIVAIIIVIFIFGIILISTQHDFFPKNIIQQESGKYLSFPDGNLSKIYLINSSARYGTYDIDMINPTITIKKGEHCVIVTGTIRSDYDQEYWIEPSVQLYNKTADKVGQVTMRDSPWKSFEVVRTLGNTTSNFKLYVKYDKNDIDRYEIYLATTLMVRPPP